MLTHVLIKQAMFDLIHRLIGLCGERFQACPYQERTANMIALTTGIATLAAFQSSQLFGFAMHVLNLPTQATHLLRALGCSLSSIVGHDIVRALGSEHKPEQAHTMAFGNVFDMHSLALLNVGLTPSQRINALLRLMAIRRINPSVACERAVLQRAYALNM